MSPSHFKPNFKRVPPYFYRQTISEKLICVIIVILSVALSAVITFALVSWTMAWNSTKFALLWFSLGMSFFIGIGIINSFATVPEPIIDPKMVVASSTIEIPQTSPMYVILYLGNLIMFYLTIELHHLF